MPLTVDCRITAISMIIIRLAAKSNGIPNLIDQSIPVVSASRSIRKKEDRI